VKVCPKCSEAYAGDAVVCPLDGAELRRTNDPYLGRTIAARYRLIRRLGSGGMAAVYLARHVMIDRLSAIKILRQDFSLNPTHRERFLREARAVNRINHENIVEITDCGEMDGVAYLVMEYVDGQTLHQELASGPFHWLRAAKIAQQVASALGRAHQMGVVHRDLKPENILLVKPVRDVGAPPVPPSEQDFVKLTDFGIAKIIDAPALTFSEHLFGTPGYIAPECVEGTPVDGRTDVYSLGVVLYEMVTGALPYDARGADLLTAPLVSAPIPPSARTKGIVPELESLILQMLSKNKEDRPSDAFVVQEVLADLSRRRGGSSKIQDRASAPAPRDNSPTIIESQPADLEDESGAPSRMTANVGRIQTREIALRWQGALTELEASIEKARRSTGPVTKGIERADNLVAGAKSQLAGIERAARFAAEHQAKVDRLEARGREFRASLGHAIDELLRLRARERIHGAALGARHDALKEGTRDADSGASDVLVWEAAAVGVEAERARLTEEDLSFQIETLQTQLDQNNLELEAEVAEATGALEGSLAAVRQLTSEFVRTLDEAAAEVSGSSSARPS
jgi:eukaryotic-like serine/threonine-protein kinase